MKKRMKRYIIIGIIFLCPIFLMIDFIKYDFLQEDLIFFQFMGSKNQSGKEKTKNEQTARENKNEQQDNIANISFHITYKNTKLKALNLSQTIDKRTLVYEKIAPGTSGRFDILLISNQNMHYQVEFESKDEKPTNLRFYTTGKEKTYATLEELGNALTGTILKNEEKTIPVYWEWEYEQGVNQNQQDTIEAKKIRNYHFLIYVKGY